MTTDEPQRPDLARELIARATESAVHRAKRVRDQLDAVQLGQGRHTDHANTKFLRRILGEYEWPGHRLVGPAAARAAWSIALHSDHDLTLQRAATILLGRAVEADDALVQHWAHLRDRALITGGCAQEYGTQLLLSAEGIELCQLRAPASVDKRRATVGLPPLDVALRAVRRRYTPDSSADEAPTVVLAEAA
ncbi:DUF6624 domain-containing protein [Streptomyces anthocyanicus]|uniref:Uncharacterized protein n=1 Tax=Streptomyces lividans 1326 TaxID=1200984 RepID=A0A7U9DM38_STRLI|nr:MULTISPECIES: DUF6624 domain-containing protein [Streptomyces]EOY45630.1 hypothetical protein SLI_0912 [Streptomyces lividans 1326]KKD13927.1 hypothetical protein TR66_18220 [Streptomyces sp. WM6391]